MSGSTGASINVWVDPDLCRGHALCLTHAPDGFEFIDLEDRSQVIEGAVGIVPLEMFRAAARECPERAIKITVDGVAD